MKAVYHGLGFRVQVGREAKISMDPIFRPHKKRSFQNLWNVTFSYQLTAYIETCKEAISRSVRERHLTEKEVKVAIDKPVKCHFGLLTERHLTAWTVNGI